MYLALQTLCSDNSCIIKIVVISLRDCVLGVILFVRLKFTDMLITLGKCSSVLFCLSKQEGAVKIVPIVLNPPSMTQESKANGL